MSKPLDVIYLNRSETKGLLFVISYANNWKFTIQIVKARARVYRYYKHYQNNILK